MNTTLLFDRRRVKWQKQRFASQFPAVDFLFRETAQRLAERLGDVNRTFDIAVLSGNHVDSLKDNFVGSPQINYLVQAATGNEHAASFIYDEEALPLKNNSVDLFISNFSLHWINDLPGALIQIQRALKPDGLFLAVLPGPKTLQELRSSFEQAMLEIEGGIRPVVSPFVEVRDAGNLLQRASFALPVTDSETITLTYANPFDLMKECRFMGEANALVARSRQFSRRNIFLRMAEIYKENHTNKEGRIHATIELVFLSGWKPSTNQQQPAQRGSGTVSMRDVLN